MGGMKRLGGSKERTMVFAVATNTEASCLNIGEAESDGFAKGSGVDVRNVVLVADSPI